ncbi:DUF1569 domain-containing protein [Acidicapsa acidisoli]|uniref:DUF1569 domain-containing protein n=1 Tax=Acidicapsa acidisoli TaxID=1615681 RepID=UPI0021E02559|nr:DUF1569 domain-containing protein [Acidicapsa acidisoli]
MAYSFFNIGTTASFSLLKGQRKLAYMHPVLKSALEPLAEQVMTISLQEAQVPPVPGQGRWCAQQIMEHLILTYQLTSSSVSRQLKSGHVPKNRRNLLEFLLRVQTIGLGYMPEGIPAIRAFRPTQFTPEDGPAIAARFLEAAEEMDTLLVAARRKFGIQACGEHPFFGVMRVDEWRRYHAIHAGHHAVQLRNAIRYARSLTAVPEEAAPLTSASVQRA